MRFLKKIFRAKPDLGPVEHPEVSSASPKKPLAVVTMVYNEVEMLPFWLKHYDNEIGASDCYILDHGSSDGSTQNLSCNVMRLPRSEFDEQLRANLVSDFCNILLNHYTSVLYTDADELVMVDPNTARSLREYVVLPDQPLITTLIGMDVVHDEENEPALTSALPVLAQRSWLWPTHSLCKPTLIRVPHAWSMGFHLTHELLATSSIYLFHIAYADAAILQRRQMKRNTSAPTQTGGHHEWSSDTIINHLRRNIPWHARENIDFPTSPDYLAFIESIKPYSATAWSSLWAIPNRFKRMEL